MLTTLDLTVVSEINDFFEDLPTEELYMKSKEIVTKRFKSAEKDLDALCNKLELGDRILS